MQGVIQSTASEATLVALLAAKARAVQGRPAEDAHKVVAYCSDQAHSSGERVGEGDAGGWWLLRQAALDGVPCRTPIAVIPLKALPPPRHPPPRHPPPLPPARSQEGDDGGGGAPPARAAHPRQGRLHAAARRAGGGHPSRLGGGPAALLRGGHHWHHGVVRCGSGARSGGSGAAARSLVRAVLWSRRCACASRQACGQVCSLGTRLLGSVYCPDAAASRCLLRRVHVDAAWAGTSGLLPEMQHYFEGLDQVGWRLG